MLEVVEGAEVGEEEQVILLAMVIGQMMMWQTWFFPMGQGRMLMRRVRNREAHARDESGRVAMQVNLLESSTVPGSEVSPVKEQEKKRPRRNGGGDDETKKTLLLDRRSPLRRVIGHNENLSMELPRASECPGSASASRHPEARTTRCVISV